MTRQLGMINTYYTGHDKRRPHIFDIDDKNGSAVLLCTKRVYMKYQYRTNVDEFRYKMLCRNCKKLENQKN